MDDKLYSRIKAIAQQDGIRISDLEQECHLGKSTMNRWNKTPPSLDKVQRVADYLNVSVGYLIGETPLPNNDDDYVEDDTFKSLQRGLTNMTKPERVKALKILQTVFTDAFNDEVIYDDIQQ